MYSGEVAFKININFYECQKINLPQFAGACRHVGKYVTYWVIVGFAVQLCVRFNNKKTSTKTQIWMLHSNAKHCLSLLTCCGLSAFFPFIYFHCLSPQKKKAERTSNSSLLWWKLLFAQRRRVQQKLFGASNFWGDILSILLHNFSP